MQGVAVDCGTAMLEPLRLQAAAIQRNSFGCSFHKVPARPMIACCASCTTMQTVHANTKQLGEVAKADRCHCLQGGWGMSQEARALQNTRPHFGQQGGVRHTEVSPVTSCSQMVLGQAEAFFWLSTADLSVTRHK